MDEARVEVDVQSRNYDLRIDTDPVAQAISMQITTNSAVRITHIPSGLTSKAKTLKVIYAKLYEMERSRIQMTRSRLRMEQIGSKDRSECICTSNFLLGHVTDHCVGSSFNK
ncbi:hypothetical protein RJ641_030673 [Dillenia turbinata]|uniref:Uncharacterized protein n=1 Tax=Dillenia turbinata TaxID=194707 RepID=A0AAN8W8F8_9MAGN